MNQEEINDLIWQGTPEWKKRQLLNQKGTNSQFASEAIVAMQKAVEWIEDDRADESYINEEWYWEMKKLLKK